MIELNEKMKPVAFWSFKSVRLYLSITFGVAVMANGLIRNTLSIAMVCMVNSTAIQTGNESFSTSNSQDNSSCQSQSDEEQNYQGTFAWGTYEQGLMFSALFFGGLISTLPAGWLADRYDPKMCATVGIFMTVFGCLLTPVTAFQGGYVWLVVLRFIMGLFGQALIIPSISAIIARWIPPIERSTVVGIFTAGNQAASIIGMPLNAVLCNSSFLGGWPSIFYINGVLGAISGFVWIVFASNRPETNKFISENEKNYIIHSLSDQNLSTRKAATKNIPWIKLLLSPAMWACFVNNFVAAAGMVIITTYTPTYFKQALHMTLLANGFFGALPYIVQWIGKIFFGIIADLLKRRTKLSHTTICKLFNTISCIGEPAFLIACSYMTCSTSGYAVAFLSLSVFMFAATVPGFQTSLLCIAPAYSGIVNSVCRFGSQFAAVLAPLVVAALTPNGTVEEWRHVFYLIAILVLFAGIIFIFFGSASIQDWAKMHKEQSRNVLNNISNGVEKNGPIASIIIHYVVNNDELDNNNIIELKL